MATITPYVTGMEDGAARDGKTCVRDYLVDGTVNDGDLPIVGQPYSQMVDWPGTNYRVTSYGRVGRVRQPSGGGVTFDVMRVNGSTSFPETISLTGSMSDQVEKGMEAGEGFQVSPEHIGAREARDRDCGIWKNPSSNEVEHFPPTSYIQVSTSLTDATYATPVLASTLLYTPLPGGGYAKFGCYVYGNSYPAARYGKGDYYVEVQQPQGTTPETFVQQLVKRGRIWFYVGTSSAGSASVDHCPFVVNGAPTTTTLTLAMIGRSYIVPTYQMAFYRRTDRYYMLNVPRCPNNGRVTDWGPLAGKRYGPPVASPPPATDGQWRITAQSITGMKDTDGGYLLKIARTFQRVPYVFSTCIWNPNMYPVWTADWT